MKKKRVYEDSEIVELLQGYLEVDKDLYDYIPVGAHVRYLRRGDEQKGQRFCRGGFVRNKTQTKDGKEMFMLETSRGGKDGANGVAWPVVREDIETLWKKYPDSSAIEIHLIYCSLAKKAAEIAQLSAKVAKLQAQVDARR